MTESVEEHNFYNRMNEIGEYNYNKRLDVIFIFQLTFITILIIVALSYLGSIGLINSYIVYLIAAILTVIIILILINRFVLSNSVRNKRYWHKLNFGDGLIVPPDYISGGKSEGEFGIQK